MALSLQKPGMSKSDYLQNEYRCYERLGDSRGERTGENPSTPTQAFQANASVILSASDRWRISKNRTLLSGKVVKP